MAGDRSLQNHLPTGVNVRPDGKIEVLLTKPELRIARVVADGREEGAQAHGWKHTAHGEGIVNGYVSHYLGARGEMALAKALNIYWSGTVGQLGCRDVGPFQVRASDKFTSRLILHPNDCDAHVFFLVTGTSQEPATDLFVIHGWLNASEGKKDEYWCDPTKEDRWAYFVDQNILDKPRAISEFWLPDIIRERGDEAVPGSITAPAARIQGV